MSEDKALRIPKISEYLRGAGTLRAIESAADGEKDYVFEEVQGHVRLVWQDECLKLIAQYWDFLDLNSSIEEGKVKAKDYALSHHLNIRSELEVQVWRVLSYRRRRPTGKASDYNREDMNFLCLADGSTHNVPDDNAMLVWSSREIPAPANEPTIKELQRQIKSLKQQLAVQTERLEQLQAQESPPVLCSWVSSGVDENGESYTEYRTRDGQSFRVHHDYTSTTGFSAPSSTAKPAK